MAEPLMLTDADVEAIERGEYWLSDALTAALTYSVRAARRERDAARAVVAWVAERCYPEKRSGIVIATMRADLWNERRRRALGEAE